MSGDFRDVAALYESARAAYVSDEPSMDTVVARHPHSGRVVTTGELQAQLVYGEVTEGTVGALLVLRGLPVRGDAS